jgi:hypothetical protein
MDTPWAKLLEGSFPQGIFSPAIDAAEQKPVPKAASSPLNFAHFSATCVCHSI